MSNLEFAEDVDLEKELEKASQDVDTTETENEVEPEQQAEPVEEEKEVEEKESPRVPLAELQAERKRRQEAQREIEEYRQNQKKLEERFAEIAKKLEPSEPEVSFEENPAEWLKRNQERVTSSVEELKQKQNEVHQLTEQQQAQQAVVQRLISSENAIRKTAPDYDEAVTFLREGRAQEYRAMGYDDPAQVEQMLYNEAITLARQAIERGVEPAQMAYEIARARGYTGKTQPTKLENVQKGQERTKSLSSVGGEGEAVLDLEALANMSDAEFAQAMNEGQWDKIVKR